MRWIVALLLVSLAGCLGGEDVQELEEYYFPLIGNGTAIGYEVSLSQGTDLGEPEVETHHWAMEIAYNDFQLDGEAYYVLHDVYDDSQTIQLMRVWDHAEVRATTNLFQLCEMCDWELEVEVHDILPGFPVPLSTGQIWSNERDGRTIHYEVMGQTDVELPGGLRPALELQITETVPTSGEIVQTRFIDLATGLNLQWHAELDFGGVTFEAEARTTNLYIGDEPSSLERALSDLAFELELDDALVPKPVVRVLAPPTLDLDLSSQAQVDIEASGEATVQVWYENNLWLTTNGSFRFEPVEPGVYDIVGMAELNGEIALDAATIYVGGTKVVGSGCGPGIGPTEPCPRQTFGVPSGTVQLSATVGGGPVPVQEKLSLFDALGQEYSATSDDGVTVQANHEGQGADWQLQWVPTVSPATNTAVFVRMDVIPPA